LRVEKGLAQNSVAAYTRDIAQFAVHLNERKRHLGNAKREDVREFLQELF
jgi:site-specific recombinase XerD